MLSFCICLFLLSLCCRFEYACTNVCILNTVVKGEGYSSHPPNSTDDAKRENFQSVPNHDSIAGLLLLGNGHWMLLFHGTRIN